MYVPMDVEMAFYIVNQFIGSGFVQTVAKLRLKYLSQALIFIFKARQFVIGHILQLFLVATGWQYIATTREK